MTAFVVGSLLVCLVIAIFACVIVVTIANRAVVLSKLTFSVFLAIILNNHTPILEGGGFWSFCIYTAIILGIVFILSFSTRFSCAFQFFCTAIVSYFISAFMVYIFGGFFIELFSKHDFEASLGSEIVIKIVCIITSFNALFTTMGTAGKINIFKNKIFINIERAICSVFYGFATYFLLLVTMNNQFDVSKFVEYFVLFAGMVVFFLADCLFFDKLVRSSSVRKWSKMINGEREIKTKEDIRKEQEELRAFVKEQEREWEDLVYDD